MNVVTIDGFQRKNCVGFLRVMLSDGPKLTMDNHEF